MKFRIEVKVSDYKQIVSNNVDSLCGYPGSPTPIPNISDGELMDISQDIENLASSFVHDNLMLVELDTETRTARVISDIEARNSDYCIGMV